MKGHVRKKINKKGVPRWYAVYDAPRRQDGRRNQKWIGSFKTEKEAHVQLTKIVNDINHGAFVEPTQMTVAEFLHDWLDAVRARLRESTHASYKGNIELHVIPRIGSIKLRNLGPGDLGRLYRELQARDDGQTRSLSPTTIGYIHTIVKRALKDAVRGGLIPLNVAERVDAPRQIRTEMKVWSAEQARRFLDHLQGHRLAAMYRLALSTGMRRGEIAGLKWNDLDLDAGRVHVRHTRVAISYEVIEGTPKTKKSNRIIPLDADTLDALRTHRKRQLEERLAWGSAYVETDLVFTREDGSSLHPETISRTFQRLSRSTGVPIIRFHDLRHSWATLALEAGVPLKVVSEILGHSSVGITADTYTHVSDEMSGRATAAVSSLLRG